MTRRWKHETYVVLETYSIKGWPLKIIEVHTIAVIASKPFCVLFSSTEVIIPPSFLSGAWKYKRKIENDSRHPKEQLEKYYPK
jgi:hypothetical protein